MRHDSTSYAQVRPKWDRNDCSVRALAVAVGLTYEQAGAIFAAFGRKMKEGTSVETSIRVMEERLKMRRLELSDGPEELKYFALYQDKGRFVLHRRGHAFALVEGVIHDWEGTRATTQVIRAWEVTPETLEIVERYKELLG